MYCVMYWIPNKYELNLLTTISTSGPIISDHFFLIADSTVGFKGPSYSESIKALSSSTSTSGLLASFKITESTVVVDPPSTSVDSPF